MKEFTEAQARAAYERYGSSRTNFKSFAKLWMAVINRCDADIQLLRWLYPDNSSHIPIQRIGDEIGAWIKSADIRFPAGLESFLALEYVLYFRDNFTSLTLREQVGFPVFKKGDNINGLLE